MSVLRITSYNVCYTKLLRIAARAIGADETLVYVRAEYPLAVERMRRAVRDAGERGILGQNVFGSGANVSCAIMEGAGAFVCGDRITSYNVCYTKLLRT